MKARDPEAIRIFLCGDVMTARGIDQILPHPSNPVLFEPSVRDARDYVELAERASGPIPRCVDASYIWGDALEVWGRENPDARLVNLETSITTSDDPWPKGINYRMHPGNIGCLTAARIDVCALANNHVLDWGYGGLEETIAVLGRANVAAAGAGLNLRAAGTPAAVEVEGKGRVLFLSFGSPTSGIPRSWAAADDVPGVWLLDEWSPETVDRVAKVVGAHKRERDVVVASIHWGDNWGYEVPSEQVRLAHALIDGAGIDVVHGHSSHHPKGIEVYRGRPILYGCGDFLNDYEGIAGHAEYRSDMVSMYFADLRPGSGELVRLRMVPLRTRKLRLECVPRPDADWLRAVVDEECAKLGGAKVEMSEDATLELAWS